MESRSAKWLADIQGKRTLNKLAAHASLGLESLEDRIALAASYSTVQSWNGGLQGEVAVTNDLTQTLTPWRIEFDYDRNITDIWDAKLVSHVGNHYVIESASYNRTLGVGQTVTFGFVASGGSGTPRNYLLNGQGSQPAVTPGITIGDVNVTEGNPSTTAVSGFFHTQGNQIVDENGQNVRIAGVSWFGLETNDFAPHGLWSRGYKSMMDQIKSTGFNTIRLPYSDQLFDTASKPKDINYAQNPDLQGLAGIQIIDKIVDYAGQIGLRIMFDHHRSSAGAGPNESGMWSTSAYPESKWISNLTMLAQRYAGNSTVFGADIHNEPHGPATWGDGSANDWRLAAERAGNAILAVNPDWLIVVEGVEEASSGNYWWGGNLSNAGAYPVRLNAPGRLVYSPHSYPQSVYDQPWFSAPNYPNNLTQVWDKNWGYLFRQGIAPLLLGEFGSKLQTTNDQQWFAKMVDYLAGDLDGNGTKDLAPGQQGISWTYWSWNPNSSDTGGILTDNWTTVHQNKVSGLQPVQFSFGAGAGTTTAVFTVSLSQATSQTVTVRYATAGGTATAGTDFTAATGTLTFAPGQTTQTVPIYVTRDLVAEGTETFTVGLSSATGGTIARTSATGTILDDDGGTPPPLPSLSITNVMQNEGNTGTTTARFTVTLSAAASSPVTVLYATANGTATAGSDYTGKSGTVSFAPGELSKTIDIAILGDTTVEQNERFLVQLSSPSGATLAIAEGLGSIINDDLQPALPTLAIAGGSVAEGNSGTTTARFTVTLSAVASGAVTVVYTTANGTAASGSDYTAKSGTITFAPGEQSKTIDVAILGDTTVEANETFLVRLTSASGATVATSEATGTIVNDDAQQTLPTLAIAGASTAEGNSGTRNLVFTVTLSKAATSAVTVRYATTNGTATAGSDYNATSGTITFAAGTTSRTVTVVVRGDTTVEANETFSVALSSPSGATIATGAATGTITNDDQPPTQAPAVLTVRDDWRSGFVADMTITNTGTTTTSGWQLEFELDANITNIWNAQIVSHVGNRYVIRMAPWNGRIAPAGKVTFGFQASGSDRTAENVKLTLL